MNKILSLITSGVTAVVWRCLWILPLAMISMTICLSVFILIGADVILHDQVTVDGSTVGLIAAFGFCSGIALFFLCCHNGRKAAQKGAEERRRLQRKALRKDELMYESTSGETVWTHTGESVEVNEDFPCRLNELRRDLQNLKAE